MAFPLKATSGVMPRPTVSANATIVVPTRRRPAFLSTLAPRRQPFVYLAATLALGILLDHWLMWPRWLVVSLFTASLVCSTLFVFVKKAAPATIALLVSVALIGAWLSLKERDSMTPSRLKQLFESHIIQADDPVELTGVLTAPPEPVPDAYFLDLEAASIGINDKTIAASGRVRLFISPSDEQAADEFHQLVLDTGSCVRVLVRLERAHSYSNPGSPDFNDFLERRGYDLKGTIKSPLLIESLGKAKTNRVLAWLYRMRLGLMERIDARFNAPVSGTLKAMLTGNRYFLDPRVVEHLRASATFHTLVIAGLHIGILAWAILRVRWDFWRRGSKRAGHRYGIARVFAAILVLWAFAVMVALAPPVERAATMITIGLIGPLLFRQSASINTVSLAAFVMLALKPALISDPGFQLSFAAVGAIVALALPFIQKLEHIGIWRPNSRSPHPPTCSPVVRTFAEMLFWDEREFQRENHNAPIRYHLEKSAVARWLNRTRLQPLVRAIALLIVTSAVIQLATLPLMAVYFNRVSPIGVLLNVTSGLLTGTLMLVGLAAILITPLSAPLASVCVAIVNAAHHLLDKSMVPFEHLTFATFRVAHYEGRQAVIYALYFVLLVALAVLLDRWRPVDQFFPLNRVHAGNIKPLRLRVAAWACLVAMIVALIVVMRPPAIAPNGKLTVHFLDVGQGDAALVIFPQGTTMLVDAGGELPINREARHSKPAEGVGLPQVPKAQPARLANDEDADADEMLFNDSGSAIGEAVVSRFLWSQHRTQVDYVLATHADADHIAGFSQVMNNFRIGQALVGHRPDKDGEYRQFADILLRRGIPLGSLAAGERFDIEGVTVEVLWPPPATSPPVTSDNNDSVVLRLVYGSTSIVLAGDIEEPAEAAIIASGVDLHADVLKVPHHGSKTSSTPAFLDRLRPRYAIISVGERSRFGHPHQIVVDRYRSLGVQLLQTGRNGMVTAESDGTTLNLSPYRNK